MELYELHQCVLIERCVQEKNEDGCPSALVRQCLNCRQAGANFPLLKAARVHTHQNKLVESSWLGAKGLVELFQTCEREIRGSWKAERGSIRRHSADRVLGDHGLLATGGCIKSGADAKAIGTASSTGTTDTAAATAPESSAVSVTSFASAAWYVSFILQVTLNTFVSTRAPNGSPVPEIHAFRAKTLLRT